jgi:chloramphenicol O-acetyltransferase
MRVERSADNHLRLQHLGWKEECALHRASLPFSVSLTIRDAASWTNRYTAEMKKIDLEKYPRRALLEAFRNRDIPVFSVTVRIDITPFKMFVDRGGCGFFMSLSFLISKAVNRVPELRHRMIDSELFEFDRVDPGFTVLLNDRTFSFCDSRYFEDFDEYRKYSVERINEARANPASITCSS